MLNHHQLPHINLHPLIVHQPIHLKRVIQLPHMLINQPNATVKLVEFHHLQDPVDE